MNMKEQMPQYTPRFTYSDEERKAFLAKGMGDKEIDALEQQKNALLRNSHEEDIRQRALKDLQDSLEG